MKESVQIEWLAVVCAREKGAAHVAVENLRPSTLRREHVAVERQPYKHKRRRQTQTQKSGACFACQHALHALRTRVLRVLGADNEARRATQHGLERNRLPQNTGRSQ